MSRHEEASIDSNNRIVFRVLWGNPAARLTAEGTRNQPARDIFTPDEATKAEVREIVRDFGRRLLRGE